jgi:hypothetical protein
MAFPIYLPSFADIVFRCMPMLNWQIIITDDGGVAAADDRLQGLTCSGWAV